MHFRPHPKGYMRKVEPVLPWTLKNSTLYNKVVSEQYDVCVITVCQLLGTYKKEIFYGDDAVEKAISVLKPFTYLGRNRTVQRYRKREKVCGKSIKEIFDWEHLHVTTDDCDTVFIALKKK